MLRKIRMRCLERKMNEVAYQRASVRLQFQYKKLGEGVAVYLTEKYDSKYHKLQNKYNCLKTREC